MKYIIEIDKEYDDVFGGKLYSVKGCNGVYFSQRDLDKLEKYKEPDDSYKKGYEDARKKFDPWYMERGDVVRSTLDYKRYAFLGQTDEDHFIFMSLENTESRETGVSRAVLNAQFVKTNDHVKVVTMVIEKEVSK